MVALPDARYMVQLGPGFPRNATSRPQKYPEYFQIHPTDRIQRREYTAKVAASEKEVCTLIEAGFEFVCDYSGNKIFRKRK